MVVARHFGAGDEIMSEPMLPPAFIYLVNVSGGFLEQTLVYFRIYAAGLIFQFGYNIFSAILRAVGGSAATLYFMLISSVMITGPDMLFVASFHCGVAGAVITMDTFQQVG